MYSDQNSTFTPDQIAGLTVIEERLLTLIEETGASETERRQTLAQTLIRVRCEKAALEVRITPNVVGATRTSHAPQPHASELPIEECLDLPRQGNTMPSGT